MSNFLLFIGIASLLFGIKLVYDARPIVKKYFSMAESNDVTNTVKVIGTILLIIGGFLISLEGKYDIITNLTASLTCVSNVGPGFGSVGPVDNFVGYGVWGKSVLSLLMLFGRLELLPMFILFTRSAWHKY